MVECSWRYGKGACGKSYAVYELHQFQSIFHFENEQHFLKKYKGENTVLINYDETRPSLEFILSLLDNKYVLFTRKYEPIQKKIKINHIEIISLESPTELFKKQQILLRRLLSKIKIYYHYKEGEQFLKVRQ
tara:strand:+ start:788 stop:1183 length:396 start_codon:yes stop_codon:yes gene_type:complete